MFFESVNFLSFLGIKVLDCLLFLLDLISDMSIDLSHLILTLGVSRSNLFFNFFNFLSEIHEEFPDIFAKVRDELFDISRANLSLLKDELQVLSEF